VFVSLLRDRPAVFFVGRRGKAFRRPNFQGPGQGCHLTDAVYATEPFDALAQRGMLQQAAPETFLYTAKYRNRTAAQA
jgi:hypothetical protein